jgi:hypothetical protein
MSVHAPTHAELAGYDGSGDADFWEHAEGEMTRARIEGFVADDVGRRTMLAGKTAMAGFAEDFHTDRIMPKRVTGRVLSQAFLGPDNYLG